MFSKPWELKELYTRDLEEIQDALFEEPEESLDRLEKVINEEIKRMDDNTYYRDLDEDMSKHIETIERPNKINENQVEAVKDDKINDNLDNPEEYDSFGCPVVPFAFSGMTGRLGNSMSTYVNFIALQWKLGYKYFLPQYMNHHSWADPAKPYFQSIFNNVTFPTASWSKKDGVFRDANDDEVIVFNNSRTGYQEKSCGKEYLRFGNVEPLFSDLYDCAEKHGCAGKNCLACSGGCTCTNIWVTVATGANFPYFRFIGSVLDDIIKYHLQFTQAVAEAAKEVIKTVGEATGRLEDMVYIGVHVRRTDFDQFSKFWIENLVNETFFEAAMDHFRTRYPHVVFLVVSDDMDWCKDHLTSSDTFHIGGTSPEVDMAVMANCNGSIIDYGTFGLWGAVLAGGEVVVTSQTFRDVRWAADYFGWTYI